MMRAVSQPMADSPATLNTLAEIQEEMRHMCVPHYDEFHKVVSEHGFIKITIPKKQRS